MTTYAFRLRFLLSKSRRIHHDSESLVLKLPTCGLSTIMRAIGAKRIEDTDNVAVIGNGFPSEKEALEHGKQLKKAILIVGASLRMGIDAGKDKARGYLGKAIKDIAKKQGLNIIDDVHGLCVYEEDLPVSFGSVSGDVILGTNIDKFVKELTNTYIKNPTLSEKQVLALELYNSAHFESSLRARFLALVTAVEALATRSNSPKDVVEYLNILIRSTLRSTLTISKKRYIIQGLGNLKHESISNACRSLVKKRLGKEAETEFSNIYVIRGKMLHTGRSPEGIGLGRFVPQCDELVSRLIIEDIQNSQ